MARSAGGSAPPLRLHQCARPGRLADARRAADPVADPDPDGLARSPRRRRTRGPRAAGARADPGGSRGFLRACGVDDATMDELVERLVE